MFYRECPYCGENLDPGEHCDCQERRERMLRKRIANRLKIEELLEDSEWKQGKLEICY